MNSVSASCECGQYRHNQRSFVTLGEGNYASANDSFRGANNFTPENLTFKGSENFSSS